MIKYFVCGRLKNEIKTQTTHVEKSNEAFSDASSTLAVSTKYVNANCLKNKKGRKVIMLDVLLNVLAVIGIIIVGGFVVVFLGNLLLNVLDAESRSKNEKKEENYIQPEQITYTQAQPQPQRLNYIEPEPYQTQDYTDIDLQKASEEEAKLNGKDLDEAYARLRAEEEAFRQEREKFIEEQKKSKESSAATEQAEEVNELEENTEKEIADDSNNDLDLDDIFFDEDEEIVEEPQEETEKPQEEKEEELVEEPQEDNQNEPEEPVDVTPIDDERVKELEAELEKQKAELEEYKRRAQEAEGKLVEETSEAQSDANLTLEEYEQRLEILTQRLKDNDKQLKAVKKEYLPLARVRRSLENDKKKLRRRESIVAKQRVILYGVNNFGDIDEEKAKKLQEDQELLDGLKSSVAHCEEILDKNKDRLPILENTYNILVENSNNLKADIAETNAKIEELKNADDANDTNASN